MVDLTDITRATMLNGELDAVERALDLFSGGARIVSLTLMSDQAPWRSADVNTSAMPYPPQMVETIKGFLSQRAAEIRQQLGELGVTGVAA